MSERVRWWQRTRWWQGRRALQIAREQATTRERVADCERDEHDWDLDHPFTNHGRPAVVCLWCGSVYVDLLYDGWAVIYPWSEVYPSAEAEARRLK